MAMIVPRAVEPDAEGRVLRVTWADGHRSVIPYQTLREQCPCAGCRTAREEGKRPLLMVLATRLLGWKRLGNYALHFSWGDSHQDGIFAYDYLRGLCPCEDCADRDAAGP